LNENRFVVTLLRNFVKKSVPKTLFRLYRVQNGFSLLFALYLYDLIRTQPADLFMLGKQSGFQVLQELTTNVSELLSSDEITVHGQPLGILLASIPDTFIQDLLIPTSPSRGSVETAQVMGSKISWKQLKTDSR
jgi:hypothetical protein